MIGGALFVLACIWLREMAGRWRRDLAEFRSTEDSRDRIVLALVWFLTALVAVYAIQFLISVAGILLQLV